MNKGSQVSKDSLDLFGFETFKNDLEKHFFAEAEIIFDTTKQQCDYHLAIYLNCDFTLTDCLLQLNNGNWGGFCSGIRQVYYCGLEKSIDKLRKINANDIVIEELTLSFNDTSLIISKIHNQSIESQLYSILVTLSEHFIFLTKGNKEVPYEIFIPIFKDSLDLTIGNTAQKNLSPKKYFEYWGLYFNSDENIDSLIYDVNSKTILRGDVFLLDKEG